MKTKILVVDNERDIAKALKVRLKTSGYDVILASDSIQAYVMAHKEMPDLIILETFIPGGGGFIVAERLKGSVTTRHIPIIFLTEISGGEKRAYRLGACSYLMKPYDPSVLLGEITKALEADERQSLGPTGENMRISPLPA
jgi:putative two-component system response regulator